MQFTVPRTPFLRVLERATGVAEKNPVLPILSCVLLTANDKATSISVAATNNYTSFECNCDAEIARPGSVAIHSKNLMDRVRAMPEGGITFTLSSADGGATLKSVTGPRRYVLSSTSALDFPKIESTYMHPVTFPLSAADLVASIARVQGAVSQDVTRPHINGALVEYKGEQLRFVATDGHRLNKSERRVDKLEFDVTMLLPLKALVELRKFADGAGKEAIRVSTSGRRASFTAGLGTLTVTLTEANFPPYEQVIPTTFTATARVNRESLLDVLKAASIAAPEKTGGVKIQLQEGLIKVSTESPESGAFNDEVAADFEGSDLEAVRVNSKYLIDALGIISGDDVLFSMGSPLDPMVIRSAKESEGDGFLAVVMPMRI